MEPQTIDLPPVPFKRNRTGMLIGLILIVAAGFIIYYRNTLLADFHIWTFASWTIAVIFILIGFLVVTLFSGLTVEQWGELLSHKPELEPHEMVLKSIEKLSREINEMKTAPWADSVSDEAGRMVKGHVENISTEYLMDKIDQKYKAQLIQEKQLNQLTEDCQNIYLRLGTETARLRGISNINLLIGFATTVLAIYFLVYTLITVKSTDTNLQAFLFHLIPRLSIVVFIEIFSFFFLKMYKKNLDDIKYFGNERTNIELKLLSIKTAIIHGDQESIKFVIQQLANTERNFILKKNESTVEMEKYKVDSNNSNQMLTTLLKWLNKK